MDEKNLTPETNTPEVVKEENITTEIETTIEIETLKKGKKVKKSELNEDLYFESDAQAKKYVIQRRIKLGITYFLLVLAALFTLLPFYWMIITSFKTEGELLQAPPTFFPLEPTFENYSNVFNSKNSKLLGFIINTLFVSIATTILVVVTTVLAAFAFSRLEFKGRETIFSLLLATMMVPGEMMIMTNYTTVSLFGWTMSTGEPFADTVQFLICCIIPFGASVFYIFFLRQNFKQIPNELYYAAKVDGNSDFKYLFKVMIPIAKPAIITVTILSCMGAWDAYIWPRTVSFSNDVHLVTDGLMYMMQSFEGTDTSNIMMAATTVVSIPLLLIFIFFRKYIMRGVARSGIKG